MTGIKATIVCLLIVGSTITTTSAQAPGPAAAAPIEFIKIAPGEFMMGCVPNDSQCEDEEKPAHRVRITRPFELGKYEVTQAQWQAVMGSNPSNNVDANAPVENVSWIDVQDFFAKMNARNDGYDYRLPTEAEWEYAARAGSATPAAAWPMGFEVSIGVTLKPIPAGGDAPYLATWVEDAAGKLIRAIVLWGSKDKYKPELSGFWIATGGAQSLIYKVSRATRLPGTYKIAWNGLDDSGKAVPKGNYRIIVETNRYHGTYAKQSGMIVCADTPSTTTLSGTTNFEPITIQYGPKPTAA